MSTNIKYNVRLATPADDHLPEYRYSQLNEVATCPTLAALEYGFRKSIANKEEADSEDRIALRAGKACHDVFAALRLFSLRDDKELFEREGVRLFKEERFYLMKARLQHSHADQNDRMTKQLFCLEALYTSGFVDDPDDKKRTMANLESVCAAYIDRWDFERRVWVSPDRSIVGIELPFALVIESDDGFAVRFTGTLDGLHHNAHDLTKLVAHENKTGSRIGDAWAISFLLSHQVTGYLVAASLIADTTVNDALILGSQIPFSPSNPVRQEIVSREEHHVKQWMTWLRWAVETYESAKLDVASAPKFTHSCNRFFSACPHIPFCAADPATKVDMINNLRKGLE